MSDKDTIIAAQGAEILRLQGALDDLKSYCSNWVGTRENTYFDNYFGGYSSAMNEIVEKINELTGAPNA